MKLLRILLCCALVLMLFSFGKAQITVFELTEQRQIKLTADNAETENSNTRYIIQEIAKSIPKSPGVTSITIDFESFIRIKRIDSTNYNIFCELKAMKFSGDVLYRNINISNLLIPDIADFAITISCFKNQRTFTYTRTLQNIHLINNLGYFTLLNEQYSDSVAHCEYTASLDYVKLFYSNQAILEFQKGITIINEYFNADRTIDNMLNTIKQIDLNVLERVAFNSIVLRETEKEYNRLMQFDFFNQLQLWISDPINFAERMTELGKMIETLRLLIQQKMESLDKLYYDSGIQALNAEKFDSAKYFFYKAIEYNYAYVPALAELAYLYQMKGIADSAAQIILTIYDRTLPSLQDMQRLNEVEKLVIELISEQATRRINSGDFVESQFLLDFGIALCNRSSHLNCITTMEQMMAQTKYGLYKSLLTVAEKAIENKRFEIAWLYINNALQYQAENSKYIITPLEAEKYYDILLQACMMHCEQLNAKKQFIKASELIQWVESICDTVSALNCESIIPVKIATLMGLYNERLDRIEADIAQKNFQAADTRLKLVKDFVENNKEIDFTERFFKAEKDILNYRYQTALNDAVTNIKYGFYEPAWEHLQYADYLYSTFQLQKNASIDSLKRLIAEPVFTAKYNKLINRYNSFSIRDLKQKISEYQTMLQSIEKLNSDTLNKLQFKLQQIVLQLFCDSIHQIIAFTSEQVDALIKQHHFIAADSLLHIILNFNDLHPECQISIQQYAETIEKLKTAVAWEKEMLKLQQMVSAKQWKESFVQFEKVEKLSQDQYVFMWNVPKIALDNFIIQQNSPEYLIAGFEYFYENKYYDHAFLMLNQMRRMGISSKETKNIQQKLGFKMAVRDIIANAQANYKINILKYTEGESYFLYFSKSYRKTWRKNKFKIL